MTAAILLVLYLVLAFAPLGLAAAAGLPPRPFLDDFSSALAMLAFATLLVEFLLSGRFRSVSGRIGLDVTVRFHQLFARTVLGLVLLHPFLYTLPLKSVPQPWHLAAEAHLVLHAPAMVSGVLAWVLLGALVITGIARDGLPYKYQTWRLGHGVGAALVAGFAAYHALNAGRYTLASPVLGWFWLTLLGVALVSLAFVYVVAPMRRARTPFRVRAVRQIADRTWELVLRPTGERVFPFKAGQFVWLAFRRTPFGVTDNPFSIATAPTHGPEIGFVIKEAGDFTRSLGSLRKGARVWVDGPHGTLVTPPKSFPGVGLIAGGVGIAPLIGILREMRASHDPRPARLLFGNRIAEQIVYAEELARLAEAPETQVHHVLGEPPAGWQGLTGVIDRAAIEAAFGDLPDLADWAYLLCGPAPMIESAEAALRALGVPGRHIFTERFVYE